VNSTADTLKKSGLGERIDKAWFSHLVRHPARKRSGSIQPRSPHGRQNYEHRFKLLRFLEVKLANIFRTYGTDHLHDLETTFWDRQRSSFQRFAERTGLICNIVHSNIKLCTTEARLTQASSIQLIVSNRVSLWGRSCCGWRQQPTGSPGIARLPVDSNARAVVSTSCMTLSQRCEVMRNSAGTVNVMSPSPAF